MYDVIDILLTLALKRSLHCPYIIFSTLTVVLIVKRDGIAKIKVNMATVVQWFLF